MVASGSGPETQRLMGLLGVGAQYGIVLPFSRAQEKESDLIGLDLMARAGFDPRESVTLWENMSRLSRGQAPPELMSTHPAPATRIAALEHRIPLALPEFEKARAAGRNPACG